MTTDYISFHLTVRPTLVILISNYPFLVSMRSFDGIILYILKYGTENLPPEEFFLVRQVRIGDKVLLQ